MKKKTKISNLPFLLLLMIIFSSVVTVLTVNDQVSAASYACTDKYTAWAQDKDNREKRQTLNSCIRDKGGGRRCEDPRNHQSGSQSKQYKEDTCKDWYQWGFFGSKVCSSSRDPSGNNAVTCNSGSTDRSLYSQQYRENRPTDTTESPSEGETGADTEPPSTGDTARTGANGNESKPSEWRGDPVGVDKLKPGNIKVTEAEAKQAGLFNISADNFIIGILNAVYTIVGSIAVVAIIAAGIIIITADGDANKVATARKAIIYSFVGLAVVGSAFIITGIIQGIGAK